MITMLNRLVLQLALGAAFGTGQLILAMATVHVPLASAGAHLQPTAAEITNAPPAPVGMGWG